MPDRTVNQCALARALERPRPLPSARVSQYNLRDVKSDTTNRAARCVVLLAICLLLAPSARAEEPDTSLGYQGAYWGLQAHVGLLLPPDLGAGGQVGPAYGVSGRLATIVSLIDVQANVMAGHYLRKGQSGGSVEVDRLSVGVEAHLHPFLTLMLRHGDFFFRWLSGLYGSLGLDLDMVHTGSGRWHYDAGLRLGGGSDIPLTDPDQGWGIWLGVSYHAKVASPRVPGLGQLDEQTLLLTLAYRNNDIYFTRAPRPEEIQYKDHPLDD